jgi:hypothetical protein
VLRPELRVSRLELARQVVCIPAHPGDDLAQAGLRDPA